MKSDFDDTYIPPDLDPVDGVSQDFPWADVFERLDSGEGIVANDPEQFEAIFKLMNLILANAQGTEINLKAIGLRVIALGWVLNPANFPGSPSLREVAKRCGVSASALAHFTGEISRATGIRNRAQRHAANWKRPERSTLDMEAPYIETDDRQDKLTRVGSERHRLDVCAPGDQQQTKGPI